MHPIAMPEIEHRRHSWRSPTGVHLTQQGVELARRVGETMGKFDIVITSDLPRAFETAIAMGYAVDSQAKALAKIDAELAKLKAIWDTDLPAFNKLAAGVPVVK